MQTDNSLPAFVTVLAGIVGGLIWSAVGDKITPLILPLPWWWWIGLATAGLLIAAAVMPWNGKHAGAKG